MGLSFFEKVAVVVVVGPFSFEVVPRRTGNSICGRGGFAALDSVARSSSVCDIVVRPNRELFWTWSGVPGGRCEPSQGVDTE